MSERIELPVAAGAERCETCRFWRDSGGTSTGNCRRFPQHQPFKLKGEWCGEWQPKRETMAGGNS